MKKPCLSTLSGLFLSLSGVTSIRADIPVDLETGLSANPNFGKTVSFTAPALISAAVKGAFVVAGVASFFFLLLGTIQWIFSGGEKEGVEKARKKITAAIVGLALILSTYAIIQLVQLIFGVSILGILQIPSI